VGISMMQFEETMNDLVKGRIVNHWPHRGKMQSFNCTRSWRLTGLYCIAKAKCTSNVVAHPASKTKLK